MGQVMQYSRKTNETPKQVSRSWDGPQQTAAWNDSPSVVLNVRAVDFIARPSRAAELHACLNGRVLDSLKKWRGFSGAVILSSHKEARLLTVLSFWSTAGEAVENKWEESRVVHEALLPLIDVCSRVHTYEAVIPANPGAVGSGTKALAC